MKTGLFFGTFNPVHIGHLIIAQYFLDHTDLDNIRFIVSPLNPLKDKNSLIAAKDRLEMVKLAIMDNPKFHLSNIEFHLPLPSYTVQTLKELKNLEPEVNFVILMGSDSLSSIEKWKDYRFILENYTIYVYPRNSDSFSFDQEFIRQYPDIILFNAPLIEISGTLIRNNLKENKSIRYLTNPQVVNYLYRLLNIK